jgi:hypothetical protein
MIKLKEADCIWKQTESTTQTMKDKQEKENRSAISTKCRRITHTDGTDVVIPKGMMKDSMETQVHRRGPAKLHQRGNALEQLVGYTLMELDENMTRRKSPSRSGSRE